MSRRNSESFAGLVLLAAVVASGPGVQRASASESFDELRQRLARQGYVEVTCRKGEGASREILKNMPCEGKGATLLDTVKRELNKRFERETQYFYRGKKVAWSTGKLHEFEGPVCNLTAGEIERSSLAESPSCGNHCNIRVDKSFASVSVKVVADQTGTKCARERAWYHGGWLQARNFHRLQVLREWQNKRVSLTDFEGTRPSASLAAAAVDISNMSNGFINEWMQKHGEAEVAALRCTEAAENEIADQSACDMEMLSQRLLTGWIVLLSNEINLRAQKDFITRFGDTAKWLDHAQGAVGAPCQSECKCLTCSDDELSRCANGCYRREIVKFVRGRLAVWDTPGDYPRAGARPPDPKPEGSR